MASKAAFSIDAKHVAMQAESKDTLDQNLLLEALITSLQQKPSDKPANWVDLRKILAPKVISHLGR